MGVEQTVTFPGGAVPAWREVQELLARSGFPVQLRMIDGELAFPDEMPTELWRKLRVGSAAGMVTLRRGPDAVTFVTWGNAEVPLLRARNALAWAFAEMEPAASRARRENGPRLSFWATRTCRANSVSHTEATSARNERDLRHGCYNTGMLTFIIGTHDKREEVRCYREILSFYPPPYEVIVVHSAEMNPGIPELPEVREVPRVIDNRSDPDPGKGLGPTLNWLCGLKHCRTKYSVYRNSDDWVFNHDHVKEIVMQMEREGKKVAGYNWFGHDHWNNITLNELYVRTDILRGIDFDEWKRWLGNRIGQVLCEYAVAEKLKEVAHPTKDFLHLPGREDPDREEPDGIANVDLGDELSKRDNSRWV
jgi:hypothetical protein